MSAIESAQATSFRDARRWPGVLVVGLVIGVLLMVRPDVWAPIGFILLVVLPGAWISFGLPLGQLPLWARVGLGAVLGPLVILVQFYGLRLLGLPFELTPPLLVALNLPAFWLLARNLRGLTSPRPSTVGAAILVLVVPLACYAPQLLHPEVRLYTGHAWMYSDPIYLLARGDLVLEDPELAGVRLAYPWGGLAFQAMLSSVLGSPPAVSYIWTNIVWLLLICAFTAGIVAELGGSRLARLTSPIWLLFGVNLFGFVGEQISMGVVGQSSLPWGDYRYTPWLLKFLFFQQEPIALGMLAALAFVLVRRWSGGGRHLLMVVGLLLVSLGVIYPVLFPVAAALVVARAVAGLIDTSATTDLGPHRQALLLGAVLLGASVVTFAHLEIVTLDVVGATVQRSGLHAMLRKAGAGAVAMAPLLLGLGVALRSCWRVAPGGTLVLLLGGLASYGLYVGSSLPGFAAEYKFMFAAALCLAPFPSIALEPWLQRLGTRAVPVLAVLILVLAAPLAYKLQHDWPWYPKGGLSTAPPAVELGRFDLRLAGHNPWSSVVDAIRERTPVNTVLVVDRAELHLPTLTHRTMYAPPAQEKPHPGVNIVSRDTLSHSRGYDSGLLAARASTLEAFLGPGGPAQRGAALERILMLNRPVAVVLDTSRHAGVLDWLAAEQQGYAVYEDQAYVLWLFVPDTARAEGWRTVR